MMKKNKNKCISKATIQAMEFGLFGNYKMPSRCVFLVEPHFK